MRSPIKLKTKPTPPAKPRNADRRPREYLTQNEAEKLIRAAAKGRKYGHRNKTLLQLMYRHALRVSEAVNLKWAQLNLDEALLYVTRLKRGTPSTHPLQGNSIRALRRLRRAHPHSPYVFVSERSAPLTRWTVGKMVAQAGRDAGFNMPIHPHMLRHATGYKLVNEGRDARSIQGYMGHRKLEHIIRYTKLDPKRFKDFWQG